MTDGDFQQHVIENLAALRTSMTFLVGPDGESGRMAKVEEDVAELKRERDQNIGANRVKHVIWAAMGSAAAGLASLAAEIFHIKHHP